MTITVNIVPKTIEEGYDGQIQVKMALSNVSGGNYFWTIRNNSLSPSVRNMLMRSGGETNEQSVCFDVPNNLARGQHTFRITGENGRSSNIENQLPDTAALTLNVNTAQTGTASGFNINWDGSTVRRGDEILLSMSLRSPSNEAYVYRLEADQEVFETTSSTFTIQGIEQIRTFLRVKADAAYVSGTITIVPVNEHAIGLQTLLSANSNSTQGFVVEREPQPSVDSFNITFSPTDIQRGQEAFVSMSMVNPSAHSFVFRLLSTVDVFEAGAYEFTIEGDEEVRTFIRVRPDALLEPGTLRIVPVNSDATLVGAALTAAGNEHDFVVIEAAVAPSFVPSNIVLDEDLVLTYFEDALFEPAYRLPSELQWKANRDPNGIDYGLDLTNCRIQLDKSDFFQVAILRNGSSDVYLQNLRAYSGRSYMRIGAGAVSSSVVEIGGTQFYRFTGSMVFKVYVKQNLSAPETRAIHTEIASYMLFHQSKRKQQARYAALTVFSPSSSFNIDAISDGFAQSNLTFPYTYDVPV